VKLGIEKMQLYQRLLIVDERGISLE